jgi:septum site-determining protein MinC
METVHTPSKPTEHKSVIDLKGSLFTLTVLHIHDWDRAAIGQQIGDKVAQAPEFFRGAPVVLDLPAGESPGKPEDLGWLVDLLRQHGFAPVGIRNGTAELQCAARTLGIGAMLGAKPAERRSEPTPAPVAPPPMAMAKVVEHPVRSGQQVYAQRGDLIVLGSVSTGAELLADGNIHVYGTLRGRALAGVNGNTEARIFCQALEAELVSIAGNYKVIEELDAHVLRKAVQILLENDRLMIKEL